MNEAERAAWRLANGTGWSPFGGERDRERLQPRWLPAPLPGQPLGAQGTLLPAKASPPPSPSADVSLGARKNCDVADFSNSL